MDGKDLVVRILGDNSDFVRSIIDSKNELDAISSVASKAAGLFGKFAGGIGLATGGMELLDTAVHSCGESQVKFENVTEGARKTVNEFFSALSTGNWSVFEDGIMNAIKLGQKYIETLRNLKKNLDIGDVHMDDIEKKMDEWIDYFKNSPDSPAKKMQRYLNEYMPWASDNNLTYAKNLSKQTEKNFRELLRTQGVNIKGLNSLSLRKIIFDYNDEASSLNSVLEKYYSVRRNLLDADRQVKSDRENSDMVSWIRQKHIKELEELKANAKEYEDKFPNIKTAYDIKVKFEGTEEFNKLLELTAKLIGIEDRGSKVSMDANEINQMFEEGFKTNDKKNKKIAITPKIEIKEEKKTQLLKELENTIKFNEVDFGEDWKFSEDGVLIYKSYFTELKKIYENDKDELNNVLLEEKKYIKSYNQFIKDNTTDLSNIEGIDKEITRVKNKMQTDSYLLYSQDKEYLDILLELRDRFTKGSLVDGSVENTIQRIKGLYSNTTVFYNANGLNINKEKLAEFNQYLKYVTEKISKTKSDLKKSFYLGSSTLGNLNLFGSNKIPLKNNTIEKLIRQRLRNLGDTYQQTLGSILGIELPTMDEQLEIQIGWANDYAMALNSCATAVQALNTTKLDDNAQGWKQFTANTLSQIGSLIAAYYALAQATGVANAMKFPFPANLAIWATVAATIVSVFNSLPSFSEGGIFEGRSDVGDMNFARVNSGEMILNNRQQKNLFNLLNGAGGTVVSSNNQVEFKIQGRELVGVLNNYNNKMRKV